MAKLIRSAKSGSDWGQNELMSYNITVATIPPQQFFHQAANPSLAGLDPTLITAPLDVTDVSDDTYCFLSYLDLATNAGQETTMTTWLMSSSAQLALRNMDPFCIPITLSCYQSVAISTKWHRQICVYWINDQ